MADAAPPLVKICSARRAEHAALAREAGADLIGMIFADAPRRIEIKDARAVRRELGARVEVLEATAEAVAEERRRAGRPLLVGVFARQSLEEILRVLDRVDLDLVQLSGGEHPALASRIPRPVLRALHVGAGDDAASLLREARRTPATITQLDAKSQQGGGTGRRFDWRIAAEVAARRPIMLAGGLTPDNVGDAVRQVRPWAVDVSSGVETDGEKDPDKIAAFIAAATSVDTAKTARESGVRA